MLYIGAEERLLQFARWLGAIRLAVLVLKHETFTSKF